jgi:hypothetical protein
LTLLLALMNMNAFVSMSPLPQVRLKGSAPCPRTWVLRDRTTIVVEQQILPRYNMSQIPNTTYQGVVHIQYKTRPHCLYICEMIVATETTEEAALERMNLNFSVNTHLTMKCNSTGCLYQDTYHCVNTNYKSHDEL